MCNWWVSGRGEINMWSICTQCEWNCFSMRVSIYVLYECRLSVFRVSVCVSFPNIRAKVDLHCLGISYYHNLSEKKTRSQIHPKSFLDVLCLFDDLEVDDLSRVRTWRCGVFLECLIYTFFIFFSYYLSLFLWVMQSSNNYR